MKKRSVSTAAVIAAICLLAGCSGSGAGSQTTTASASGTASVTEAAAEETTTETEKEYPVTNTTTGADKDPYAIPVGTVLYDANDIRITTSGITTCPEYFDEKMLALDITNNTGKELSLYFREASIGGWMNDPDPITISEDGQFNVGGIIEVPATNDTNRYGIHINDSVLERYGFSALPDMEFVLEIVVGDDWENSIFTDRIRFENPDMEGFTAEYDDSGKTAYDKDGVKIVLQGAGYDPGFWGPTVSLYAYNGTDKTINIRIPQSSLNGEEHEAYGDAQISPGKHLREEVMFGNAAEVSPLGTVTMTFDIYEYDPDGEGRLLDTSEPFTAEYEPAENSAGGMSAEAE